MVDVLAEAFIDEPMFRWLQPDDSARERLLPAMFETLIRYVHPVARGSEVFVDGGAIVGAAVWAPPGRWKPPWWRQLQGLPKMLPALARISVRTFATRGNAIDRAAFAVHPSEPHWYLAGMGVAPSAQGRGVGSALVRSGLERCSRAGTPAYLECVPDLQGFYESLGFRHLHDLDMPKGAPDQIGMWFDPPDA